jgi:metallo-beta-lactamase class B
MKPFSLAARTGCIYTSGEKFPPGAQMKRIIAALVCLALGAAVASAEDPFAATRVEWNKPAKPFHIIGNVYYVGTNELSVYLIATPQGAILIDQGLPESVPQIEQNIASLGFKLKDVKILLSGHAHFDHFGGLAGLRKDTGASVVAAAADKPYIEAGVIAFGPSRLVPVTPVKVDRAVTDGDTVELGGTILTAVVTPGHTPGCIGWRLTARENGKTYSVLFAGSVSVGGNPLVNVAEYPAIADDYRASFARLKTMTADVLLTEHQRFADEIAKAARAAPGKPNPFVDPGALQRYVAASEADFNKELAAQTKR